MDMDFEEMSLVRQEIVANPHKDLSQGRGLKVVQFLLGFKPDVVISRERLEGKGPGYAFAEAGVETVQTDAETLVVLVAGILEAEGKSANL